MKKQYTPPELTKVGDLTKTTRGTLKDLGLHDGQFFKNQNNPLVTIS